MCAGTNNSLWTERDSGQAVEHWTEECVTHNNKITSGYVLQNCFFFGIVAGEVCTRISIKIREGYIGSTRRGPTWRHVAIRASKQNPLYSPPLAGRNWIC